MPGPLTIATLHQAARVGVIAGPLATLGHAILELLMALALTMGLAHVLKRRALAGAIALAGGLMLVWMAWGMVRTAGTATLALQNLATGSSRAEEGGALMAGIVMTLGNPYWFLWWVTVGASNLGWARQQARGGSVLFWAGHVASDLVWLTLLALAIATGRHFLTDSLYRGLLYVLGAAIGVLGAFFMASAKRLYSGALEGGRATE
jgi:threonine/homoserine/homoserine lactone efflux protein